MRFENAFPCAAAGCVAALLAACAANPVAIAPEVPQSLRVPDRLTVSHELPATGVQIYECVASKVDPTRFEWVFRAPEAELFDTAGHRIGKHYGGPTWEANDGSKVVGAVKASDDGPDSTAIPWLLLVAKSTSGPGAFSRIQSIQRINTVGGKAPAGGCTEAQAGKEARVPYKATYYFYVPSA